MAVSGWTVYYDGECGLCRATRRALAAADFRGAVTWLPFQSLESPPAGLTWEDLARAAFLKTSAGRLYEGFYAFRMLCLRLPALWPLVPVLWLPGAGVLGSAAYRWVARNRHRF